MADRAPTRVIRERAELLALLKGLDPEDWKKPTQCTDWTVADVAAHVLAWEQLLAGATMPERCKRTLRLLVLATTSRFNVDRINYRLQRRSPDEPAEILAALATPDTSNWKWRFDRLSPGAQLAEYMVHHEDVRTAVQRPRVIPQERLAAALDGVNRLPGMPTRKAIDRPTLSGRDRLLYLAGR